MQHLPSRLMFDFLCKLIFLFVKFATNTCLGSKDASLGWKFEPH